MLKRVYIDNYKSLVNVEIGLKEINLFLGANGAGKSAVFEGSIITYAEFNKHNNTPSLKEHFVWKILEINVS